MKRSLAYPVFFFIFISHYSFAQTKWEPGYVITSSRDTLNGMIEYKNWKINPTEINFKSSDGDKITIYAQDDIDEFSVHHEKYIKAKVSVNISSDKLNELSQNPNPELVTRTVMLLSVYQGSKGLFMLHTSEDKDNLYIRINNEYVLLTQYTYRRYNSGGSDVIHQDHYKQQLVNYFSDCPGILPKINFVQYSSK